MKSSTLTYWVYTLSVLWIGSQVKYIDRLGTIIIQEALDSNLASGKFKKNLVGITKAIYEDRIQIKDLFL